MHRYHVYNAASLTDPDTRVRLGVVEAVNIEAALNEATERFGDKLEWSAGPVWCVPA